MSEYTVYTHKQQFIKALDQKFRDFPYFMLTSDLFSFLGWQIRSHTKHGYSHSMTYHKFMTVASQDWYFEERPLTDYLHGERQRIKMWYAPEWTDNQKEIILSIIDEMLEERGKYDWLGIIGQRFHIPWFNFKKRSYCSEQVAKILKMIDPVYLNCKLFDINHPSPADLDLYWTQRAINDGYYKAVVYDPTLF